MVPFVRGVRFREPRARDGFPFDVPAIARLERLELTTPVTFFVGENGSGKSTLLEAIGVACRAVAAGSHDVADDATLAGSRALAAEIVIESARAARTKLYLRAEDVFGYASRLEAEIASLAALERDVEDEGEILPGSGRARQRSAYAGSRRALEENFGADAHARSHGEMFLALLQRRLVPAGLYLLDEPETPLSPSRVLALISMISRGVREGSQFIIATHSPILMALPGATIYVFDDGRIARTDWDDVEHVRMTRAFLKRPEAYLRHLDSGE